MIEYERGRLAEITTIASTTEGKFYAVIYQSKN